MRREDCVVGMRVTYEPFDGAKGENGVVKKCGTYAHVLYEGDATAKATSFNNLKVRGS